MELVWLTTWQPTKMVDFVHNNMHKIDDLKKYHNKYSVL
tara:strand:+ start:2384 stop:2500 length:117 start_codon:yes stop_codon:yes gene_type:complete